LPIFWRDNANILAYVRPIAQKWLLSFRNRARTAAVQISLYMSNGRLFNGLPFSCAFNVDNGDSFGMYVAYMIKCGVLKPMFRVAENGNY
jgi:hypothetical protein